MSDLSGLVNRACNHLLPFRHGRHGGVISVTCDMDIRPSLQMKPDGAGLPRSRLLSIDGTSAIPPFVLTPH